MSTRLYRLQCDGAHPGRVLTAEQASRELENLRTAGQHPDLAGDLETGITWTSSSGYMAGGRPRQFKITPADEEPPCHP